MEEEKEFKVVKDKEVVIMGIELEMSRSEKTLIERIRFKANIGDITIKPTKPMEEYRDGFKVIYESLWTLSDIPDNIRIISKIIQEQGKCKVQVSYTKMTTIEKRVYRFTNNKWFKEWKALEKTDQQSATEFISDELD